MAVTEDYESLGPWAAAELAHTSHENAGIGADAGLPPEVRFLSGIVQLVRRRAITMGSDSDLAQPAVFLLHPVPQANLSSSPPRRIPMLDNGLERLTGRLWFMSAAVVSGHFLPLEEFADDDAVFRFVTDILLLGDVPTIVFDPRVAAPHVRLYPLGLNAPDECRLLSLASASISLGQILEKVDEVYRRYLITPTAQAHGITLWQDSSRWYPIKDAEEKIQGLLIVGILTAFPTCTPRHEQSSIPGRVDLEIEEHHPADRSIITRIAILELKVLRSFASSGKSISAKRTCDWVEEGVKQAAAYKADKGARGAALCCFDMRTTDSGESCFDHVRVLATAQDVVLKHWFLFASSKLYRAAFAKRR